MRPSKVELNRVKIIEKLSFFNGNCYLYLFNIFERLYTILEKQYESQTFIIY